MEKKLFDNDKSAEKAIQLFKKAFKIVKGKMSPTLAEAVIGKLVMDVNGNPLVAGDCTISRDLTQVRVRLNVNLAAGYVENEPENKAWKFIMTTVRHECLHAFQWLWVAKKAGHRGIDKMRRYIEEVDYKQSVLEKGAKMYEDEDNASLQDFNTDLAIFVK